MNLYRLGVIPWEETQAIYHALAQNGQEGLVLCRPDARCVCLGLHDDLQQEVNIPYCQANNIPLIRRDIGGGMVLLANDQIFFQLVLRPGNRLLTGRKDEFFGKFLEPAVQTLASFNIKASVKRPADIVVNGKKISGNGAGDINGFAVYTGNILIGFDRATMVNVLNVPSRRFRELTQASMERYLTTMEEELGYTPDFHTVEERLAANFAAWIGELQPAEYSEELKAGVKKSSQYLTSREFLELPGKQTKVRQVKINEGTYIRLHTFPGCAAAGAPAREFCGDSPGQMCSGYAILLIRDGKIIKFESQGLSCLETKGHITGLADCLLGSYWREPDIRLALARWQQTGPHARLYISGDTLLRWILGE